MSTRQAASAPPHAGAPRSRSARIGQIMPFLATWYVAGLAVAAWDPRPAFIFTVALGVSSGMLLLGPYAAAASSGLRLHRLGGGQLRWVVCLVLAGGVVLLLDHALDLSHVQLLLGGAVAIGGTILGHDASLAVLQLRAAGRLDAAMVLLFPALLGAAVVSGYSSFGFMVGIYRFATALLG